MRRPGRGLPQLACPLPACQWPRLQAACKHYSLACGGRQAACTSQGQASYSLACGGRGVAGSSRLASRFSSSAGSVPLDRSPMPSSEACLRLMRLNSLVM